MTNAVALIVAAGRGTRAGTRGPKQYERLGTEAVMTRTHRAFAAHPRIGYVLCVIHADDEKAFRDAVPNAPFVHGGADRQASVKLGLEALADTPIETATRAGPDLVLIHDGARPLVSAETISGVLDALDHYEGALPALPVADTLKRGAQGFSIGNAPREGLWRAQTPQGFRFETILTAHRTAKAGSATDDTGLLEALGTPVALVRGNPRNIKLTYPEDFALAEALIDEHASIPSETRMGLGYDVHAFEPGDHVTLGGITIPHTHALKGHSDADVAMHALTDALYGALCEGDIGRHFPPTEERWRGAPSVTFLRHAAGLLEARRGRVVLADVTIICEAPKVSPHAEAMRQCLSEALSCDSERISVKATTTEGLGFEGRREGIAAQAVVTVEVPR